MESVDILQCIKDLQSAKQALEEGIPLSAAAMLRCVIIRSTEAMEKIMTKRLSDPKHAPPRPGCQNMCGHTAIHCGREECKGDDSSGDRSPT